MPEMKSSAGALDSLVVTVLNDWSPRETAHPLRSQDRAELVADARLLRETTGWRVERSLEDTLAELLAKPKGHRV
jgi:nucleoside-diphosphate-sugar epimerase